MSKRIQITFTDEEYARIEREAARLKVPTNQFCKDLILFTDLSKVKSREGSFAKNHAKLISEMKAYAKKHVGHFQLRDLKCWNFVTQATFDGEEIFPSSQKLALGIAISKDVENGLIPGVRIATVVKNGKRSPKIDKNGVLIYEIYDEPDNQAAMELEESAPEDASKVE